MTGLLYSASPRRKQLATLCGPDSWEQVRYKLLDPWGEPRKAWEIARGKRGWSSYYLYDPKRKEQRKASVLAISVTQPEHARPLWLVVARLKGSKEPWYLLTSDVIRTADDAWGVVSA